MGRVCIHVYRTVKADPRRAWSRCLRWRIIPHSTVYMPVMILWCIRWLFHSRWLPAADVATNWEIYHCQWCFSDKLRDSCRGTEMKSSFRLLPGCRSASSDGYNYTVTMPSSFIYDQEKDYWSSLPANDQGCLGLDGRHHTLFILMVSCTRWFLSALYKRHASPIRLDWCITHETLYFFSWNYHGPNLQQRGNFSERDHVDVNKPVPVFVTKCIFTALLRLTR